jgi:mono/diheme cytochrome c family protein
MASRILLLAVVVAALVASAVAAGGRVATPGNPTLGKALFLRAGIFCASCHTLKAAGATGRDGPNLDTAKPSYARIVEFVTNGRPPTKRWPTGSPGYRGELTKADIRAIAAYVYGATHR